MSKNIPDRCKLDVTYQEKDVLLKMVREKFGELPKEPKNPSPEDKSRWNDVCDALADTFNKGSDSSNAILNFKFDIN